MQNVERLMAITDEPEQDEDTRLLTLVGRKREIDAQMLDLEINLNELANERDQIRGEIHELIGLDKPTPTVFDTVERRTIERKCKACGKPGHRARGKLPNGNLFCPENPEGKPLEELNG